MTQGERVRKIRKYLGLTLEKFGEKLGVGKTAISKIEHEQCALTDANIKAICREFNVDYIWLTAGEGEMFLDSDDDFIEKIDHIMAGENDARKNMIKTLANASDDDIQTFDRLVSQYVSLMNSDETEKEKD